MCSPRNSTPLRCAGRIPRDGNSATSTQIAHAFAAGNQHLAPSAWKYGHNDRACDAPWMRGSVRQYLCLFECGAVGLKLFSCSGDGTVVVPILVNEDGLALNVLDYRNLQNTTLMYARKWCIDQHWDVSSPDGRRSMAMIQLLVRLGSTVIARRLTAKFRNGGGGGRSKW